MLIHIREYIIDDRKLMDDGLRSLRCEPSPDKQDKIMHLPQFGDIVEHVIIFEIGSDGKLIVNYLKDVSFLLSLVFPVLESNIEQHLQSERNMIYLSSFCL